MLGIGIISCHPYQSSSLLCAVRFFADSALKILVVHTRIAVIPCSCFAKHISKDCVLVLVFHKRFDEARRYIASADWLLDPYENRTSRSNMCRADICSTCRCTKFIVSEKNYRRSSITSSFVESGLISSMYCSKFLMILRTFPHTAVDALSSSSRLIFPSRAPTRKTMSCRMHAVSVLILYEMTVVALAAAMGSAAAALSLSLRDSSWAAR
jgi:hypothetical protein